MKLTEWEEKCGLYFNLFFFFFFYKSTICSFLFSCETTILIVYMISNLDIQCHCLFVYIIISFKTLPGMMKICHMHYYFSFTSVSRAQYWENYCWRLTCICFACVQSGFQTSSSLKAASSCWKFCTVFNSYSLFYLLSMFYTYTAWLPGNLTNRSFECVGKQIKKLTGWLVCHCRSSG